MKSNRIQVESMPKNSPKPPHTPAIFESVRDRYNFLAVFGDEFIMQHPLFDDKNLYDYIPKIFTNANIGHQYLNLGGTGSLKGEAFWPVSKIRAPFAYLTLSNRLPFQS